MAVRNPTSLWGLHVRTAITPGTNGANGDKQILPPYAELQLVPGLMAVRTVRKALISKGDYNFSWLDACGSSAYGVLFRRPVSMAYSRFSVLSLQTSQSAQDTMS